ncbi:hypothetical protein Goshw_002256, partial [Gossypium schwendimanii]|nr:hypothetical protein [Gossypium schwendimanii]
MTKELRSKNPKNWTKAFFRCESKSDMILNNLYVAFNSNIIRIYNYRHLVKDKLDACNKKLWVGKWLGMMSTDVKLKK